MGDIGTSEEKVEQRLSYWFNLAEKWGAVMLIDEADIYLERRSVSDLKRNGIVSGKCHWFLSSQFPGEAHPI